MLIRMGHWHEIQMNEGKERVWRRGVVFALSVGCCLTAVAGAQQAAGTGQVAGTQQAAPVLVSSAVVESLPEAPVPQAATGQAAVGQAATSAGQATAGQATGMVFGTVRDGDEALVQGADVTLIDTATRQERTTVSDGGGTFTFSGVVAGDFRLMIRAKGLAAEEIAGTLTPGEIYNAPAIRLRVATANTEVMVTPETQYELAVQEVRQEEKQRVLGIVPNYFVTYEKDPVPLRAKQKFSLGLRSTLDPTHFAFAAGVAGFEQMVGMYSGFGSGPEGYGKRYGAALATTTTSELLRGSVFPSLFRQDPRYYYRGTGSNWERTKYAVETALIAKSDKGRWETNYSAIFAGFTAGAVSNFYYAPSDRHGAALTIESGFISLAGVAFGHVMQEFFFRSMTTHAPPAGTP